MKRFLISPHRSKIARSLFAAPLVLIAAPSGAADRFWDGGTVNMGTNGDGVSIYAAGTWNTTLTNWDQGSGLAHIAWDNANLDNAIFGGTYSAGTKLVTLGSSVTVNQIRILTGDAASATSANRYDIGSTADATNAITFGGTYNIATPAIDAGAANVRNTQFAAKITGTINGGLVVAHGSNGADPSSGRIFFGNAANDFTGDVTLLSGNTHVLSNLGNAANKIILSGGSLFGSVGTATTYTIPRAITVSANSGINLNATGSAAIVMDLQGALTGAANLTRYSGANVNGEVRFSGDLSGYSGTIENTGAGIMTIQSTATSGGAWKLSGGTVRLNAGNNDAIASGAGRSDLLMNAGTLNMNGKSETINGLSGAAGFVQNNLSATASTLTLGDGDASASFGGTVRDNPGTGGTLALTKVGSGTQTLGGTNSYTGLTTVTGGALLVSGSLTVSSLSVSGTIGGSGSVGSGSASLSGGTIDPGGDGGDRSLNFNGPVSGTGTISLTIDSAGSYDRITGTGLLDATSISLDVVMNDTGWLAATDAASIAAASQYDIVANPVTGNFTNGISLTPAEQAYWGVGADSKFFNFGGQDFLLTTGSFKLTAVNPVPEPASLISLLAVAGLGIARRRR